MFWKAFGARGHDRDYDAVIDPGHDLHGNGHGYGHDRHCGDSDPWPGGPGGDKGSHGGSHDHHGSGGDDYVCGGNGDDCAPISVLENTTAVTDIDATFENTDGTGALYEIVGGADAALFTIDPGTGELSFTDAPDFEAPGDTGADNVYEVTIRATSTDNPCHFEDTKYCVTVEDVEPETPPAGPNASPTITTISQIETITNSSAGTVVATLHVEDPNAGDQLQFLDLGGNEASDFTLVNNDTDPTDGIDFDLVLNADAVQNSASAGDDGIYSVTITVVDGLGGEDSIDLGFTLDIQAG